MSQRPPDMHDELINPFGFSENKQNENSIDVFTPRLNNKIKQEVKERRPNMSNHTDRLMKMKPN